MVIWVSEFCPGELILKLLAGIGEWNGNLSEYTAVDGSKRQWPVLCVTEIVAVILHKQWLSRLCDSNDNVGKRAVKHWSAIMRIFYKASASNLSAIYIL